MAMNEREPFLADLDALLAPIAGSQPAGLSMRYDARYLAIRTAREEDDVTLPMGEWERPLKRADCKTVANQSVALLTGVTKDFQVAAWLCESWTHQHQLEGFIAAVEVLSGLVERYWESSYPQIDDGDDDARVATFVWLNENLPLTLKLNVTLLRIPERMPSAINLADWDQSLTAMNQQGDGNKSDYSSGGKVITRLELATAAIGDNLRFLVVLGGQVRQAILKWDRFAVLLDEKMLHNPPSIARVGDTLRQMERAVTSLIDGRDPRPFVEVVVSSDSSDALPSLLTDQDNTMDEQGTVRHTGPIASREDAYRMLEEVVTYLQKTEPHSPTPYLVRRAVSWGRMSLVDLMQEVMREEGDLTRYFSLLGIKN